MKRIVGWVSFICLAACGFMVMLGLIIHNDSLTAGSLFALVPVGSLIVVLCCILIVRWLFSWRNLKRATKVVCVFAILGVIFYAEEDVRGWLAWHHEKQQAEAAGERLDYASSIPQPVSDDKNFALTPVVASSYEYILTKDGKRIVPPNTNVVNRMEMTIYRTHALQPTLTNGYWMLGGFTDFKEWQKYYRMPETNSDVVTNEFPIAPQPQAPAADVLLALSKYDSAIEELRQASQLPDSRFPLNYDSERPFETLLPHLASIKRCVQVLQLRALAELELGQSDNALDDVKLSFRLIDSIRTEPLLISHLVRIACLSITMQPIWEGMNKHQWSEAQLTEIEQQLGKLDFLTDSKLAMRYERNSSLSFIEHLRQRRSYDDFRLIEFDISEGEGDWEAKDFAMAVLYHLAPDGWFYLNEATIVRLHQEFWLPMTDPAKHLAIPAMTQKADAQIESLNIMPWNYFVRMLLPALGSAERKFAYAQEMADLAQLGCALERYRLAHKEYPETLDALAPQFIAQIPHDVIGGQPLHYRRKADGKFLLYSIGWNETDEGGQIGLSDSGYFRNDKGDWVWLNP